MRVCIVGNFGDGVHKVTDGQGIKTVELYEALKEYYGSQKVFKLNLYSKNKIILGLKLVIRMIMCSHLIVLVSKNGRVSVVPLMVSLNKVFRRKIFHSLIGSTTHQTLEEKPELVRIYNALAGNWSETSTEKRLLELQGLTNVSVVKNFKNLRILDESELPVILRPPYRFCTFSRVEALKGIPNVVHAINHINEKYGGTVCTLDIYGKIEDRFKDEFEKLSSEFGENIHYMGVVDFEKSVQVLKDYYMLVFPTLYYTEGIPGTIIDAFAAGLPIISAEWESCFDIMNSRVGLTYKFGSDQDLENSIKYAIENHEIISKMRVECCKETRKYLREEAIKQVCQKLEE